MNWRKHAFLLAHDAIGSGLRRHYAEFLAATHWPRAHLEKVHSERLAALLDHARKTVPFYRERAASTELRAFPILRKEDIHAHFEELMEPALLEEYRGEKKRARYSWVEVKTGGSTGTPTRVIHDANFRDWGRAGRLFSQWMCGFPIGTPFFQLWGSMRDINDAKDSREKRVLNALLQVHPLNAFRMDEARMLSYAAQLRTPGVGHLMSYVDSAEQLARFIEKRNEKAPRLESIMACAGTVTDDARATLQRVFGARVHNKYGSRECADMACECGNGGFHIYATGTHLEIVDETGQPVPAGTSGRILVTLLQNRRFPIIRYEIGDIGALSDATCSCGSPLPLLEKVEGRISEIITATNGTYVSPVYIRHLIGVVHNPDAIEKFQFTQTGATTYSLAMKMHTAFAADAFEKLTALLHRDLLKILGENSRLEITRANEIAESESGKFLYVRNLHRPR